MQNEIINASLMSATTMDNRLNRSSMNYGAPTPKFNDFDSFLLETSQVSGPMHKRRNSSIFKDPFKTSSKLSREYTPQDRFF